jgi:3-dehydroshikimate dehydratase
MLSGQAIWSLQGNFPSEGNPLLTELILVGDNALAVDLVAAKLMKIDPEQVPFLIGGQARGLGPASEEIEIIGDKKDVLAKGISFVPPELEFNNLPEGMRVVDRGVCNICRRALASGLAAAQNSPEYQDPGRVLAAVGPIESLDPQPGEDVLLVGNGTAAHRSSDRTWLPGCLPLAGQCKRALLSLERGNYKISYCSIGMRDLPLEEVIELIGPLGYEGLEIWGQHLENYLKSHSLEELKAALAKFDLAVPMIAPYFNLVAGAEELAKSREDARKFIGYAQKLGCPWIRVFTGPQGSKEAAHWMWAQATEELKQFAVWGREAAVGFAVETHQGQLADTVGSTLRLILQVDEGNFRVNLDIHNLFAMGEDPVRALKLLAPYLVHVHAKNGEIKERLRHGISLAEGNMDYQPFLQELYRQNFAGFVSVEWFGEEPMENAISELAYLQQFQ